MNTDKTIANTIQAVNVWWSEARNARTKEEFYVYAEKGYELCKELCSQRYNPVAVDLINDLVNELNCRVDPEFKKRYEEKYNGR